MSDPPERATARGVTGDLGQRIQQTADAIAECLAGAAGELAKATPRQKSTAPTQDTVATVALLHHLAEWLPKLCPRAILREVEREEWVLLTNALRAATDGAGREAAAMVIIDPEGGEH